MRKDHAAGTGLEHVGDDDVHGLPDRICRVFDHDHGAVGEVGDALAFAREGAQIAFNRWLTPRYQDTWKAMRADAAAPAAAPVGVPA